MGNNCSQSPHAYPCSSISSNVTVSDSDSDNADNDGIRSSFAVGELRLDGSTFDPLLPQVRPKLLGALGASPTSQIRPYKGCYAEDTDKTTWFNAGNMNQGIWFLRDKKEEFVLKLVKFVPSHSVRRPETEVFEQLYREVPQIANDPNVAFPLKILKVVSPGNRRQFDLHVMRRVPGRPFDIIIESYWKNERKHELKKVFRMAGDFLRTFHERYGGRQHCDVLPQNIFYDEFTEQVSIIDLGMMGARLTTNDVDAFSGHVSKLSTLYGSPILKGIKYFKEGYFGNVSWQGQEGGA